MPTSVASLMNQCIPEMWTICLSILSLDQSYNKNTDVHSRSYRDFLPDTCNLKSAKVQTDKCLKTFVSFCTRATV